MRLMDRTRLSSAGIISFFLGLVLSCGCLAPAPILGQAQSCGVIFSIGRLIGSRHFIEKPSQNGALLSEYQLRLMKDRGSAPLGPETLPVDAALEKNFAIKPGMNAGLLKQGRYRSVGKVTSISFQYREILSYFSFDVEAGGGSIDEGEGLYFVSEKPLPAVRVVSGQSAKTPGGMDHFIRSYLLQHRPELTQLLLYEEPNIEHQSDEEISKILTARIKFKTSSYKFQEQRLLITEGIVGNETRFLILEGRDKTPKMFSKLMTAFSCGSRPHLYLRGWVPGSGARDDTVYRVEDGLLTPVFTELGWGI